MTWHDFAGSAGVILIVEQPCCTAAAKGRHLSHCRPATTKLEVPPWRSRRKAVSAMSQ